MIEEEDGFFGSGKHDEIFGTLVLVDGSEDFSQVRSAGRFGVAAPMLEKGIVCSGLKSEKICDGLRIGVGGGEKIFGREFMAAHVFFDSERSDLHEGSLPRGVGKRLGPN